VPSAVLIPPPFLQGGPKCVRVIAGGQISREHERLVARKDVRLTRDGTQRGPVNLDIGHEAAEVQANRSNAPSSNLP